MPHAPHIVFRSIPREANSLRQKSSPTRPNLTTATVRGLQTILLVCSSFKPPFHAPAVAGQSRTSSPPRYLTSPLRGKQDEHGARERDRLEIQSTINFQINEKRTADARTTAPIFPTGSAAVAKAPAAVAVSRCTGQYRTKKGWNGGREESEGKRGRGKVLKPRRVSRSSRNNAKKEGETFFESRSSSCSASAVLPGSYFVGFFSLASVGRLVGWLDGVRHRKSAGV